jgi:hypothetical protein
LALAAATPATKAVAAARSAADLSGFIINPNDASLFGGILSVVAGAGDVNGDGLADLIIGSRNENVGSTIQAGRSFVVFGRTDQTAIELSNVALGIGGFVINGEKEGGLSGSSVAGVADVNGDGLDDVIVGAPDRPGSPGKDRGLSYVVFGKSDSAAVELSALGASGAGFIIRGACDGGYTGSSVAGAGDVNGDGLNDLIVGSDAYYYGSRSEGRSFVVFGKTGTSPIALSAILAGDGGFVVEHVGDRLAGSEVSVAGAGDVNGDGLAEDPKRRRQYHANRSRPRRLRDQRRQRRRLHRPQRCLGRRRQRRRPGRPAGGRARDAAHHRLLHWTHLGRSGQNRDRPRRPFKRCRGYRRLRRRWPFR